MDILGTIQCTKGGLCDGYPKCYNHHSNEALNRPKENAESLKKKAVEDKVVRSYPQSDFESIRIPGDGYCMVQSVLTALKKVDRNSKLTKEALLNSIQETLKRKIDYYQNYIVGTTVDPIAELEAYQKSGKYKSTIADLILHLTSETVGIEIIILYRNNQKQTYDLRLDENVFTPTTDIKPFTVYIEKVGEHYDALIPVIKPKSPNVGRVNGKSTRRGKLTEKARDLVDVQRPTSHDKTEKRLSSAKDSGIEPPERFCLCNKTYEEDDSYMIDCFKCKKWFHTNCIFYQCCECKSQLINEKEGDTISTCRKELEVAKEKVENLRVEL